MPFFLKKNNLIGIDIGAHSIKIIEISKNKKKAIVENYAEVATKKEADIFILDKDEKTIQSAEEKIAQSIKSALRELKIKTKEAFFSVPVKASFFTTFSISPATEKEIEKSVSFYAKQYIPLPLSEVFFDWSTREAKNGNIDVTITAVPNEIMQSYKNIASTCNLKINVLEVESFALKRLLSIKDEKIYILIDMGFSGSRVNFIKNGEIKISFTLNFSGVEITKQIANKFNLEYNEAEKLKISAGMTDENKDVSQIITSFVDQLIVDMEKYLIDYFTEDKESIAKIVVSGGNSLIKGLEEYISKKTEIPVERISFNNIDYPSHINNNTIKETSAVFSIAAGAVLCSFKNN